VIVIDCSALVFALTDAGKKGDWARGWIAGGSLAAPWLLYYEIVSALFGMARGKKHLLALVDSDTALADYQALTIRRFEPMPFLPRVRTLHADLSAYDAQYVALAESLGVPLVTGDARIKRSGAATCEVESPPGA
jgi:predicted nucleic acid-binding protein